MYIWGKNKKYMWSSNTLATWGEEPNHWKRPWSWERLREGGEGSDRGWDGWTASLTQWTRVWANSKREWRTGKPGVRQSMGSQTVGYKQQELLSNWTTTIIKPLCCTTGINNTVNQLHFNKNSILVAGPREMQLYNNVTLVPSSVPFAARSFFVCVCFICCSSFHSYLQRSSLGSHWRKTSQQRKPNTGSYNLIVR